MDAVDGEAEPMQGYMQSWSRAYLSHVDNISLTAEWWDSFRGCWE